MKRGERRRGGNLFPALFLCSVLLFAAVIGCALLWKEREESRAGEPVYQEFSMSEEAAARAYVWLSQIEDMPLSYEEIRNMMGEIPVKIIWTPVEEKTDSGILGAVSIPDNSDISDISDTSDAPGAVEAFGEAKGKYKGALADGTYEECLLMAQRGFEKAYREVLRYRFRLAGYEEAVSDEMLDERMREAYGVSVSEYLALCEVQLLPTREELLKRSYYFAVK